MLLRDYQQAAIDQFLVAPRTPTLIVAPTGAGKGTMAAYVLGRYALREQHAVFIVHRRELVRDMAQRLRQQGVQVGESLVSSRYVRVASVQAALHAHDIKPPELLVVDEAHHYAAEEWAEVIARLRPRALLGFTATPQRADGKPLGDMFARLIDAVPYSLLLARGVIVPCRVLRAPRRMRPQEIARDPVDAYLTHARGKSALVYVARVGEARRVAETLSVHGVRAGYLHARTRRSERDALLARLESGTLDVLVNVGILTEGVDVPGVRAVVLARPCHHASTYLQIVGRCLRAASGKHEALVIDLVGATHVHGMPADDRVYDLTGTGIAEAEYAGLEDVEVDREAWSVESLDLELEEIAPGTRPARLVRAPMGRPKSRDQSPGGIFLSRGYWVLTCRVAQKERRISLGTRDEEQARRLLAIYREAGVVELERAIAAQKTRRGPRLFRHAGSSVWWVDVLGRDGATREQLRLYTRDRSEAEALAALLTERDFRAFDVRVAKLAETFTVDTGKRARAERTDGFVFLNGSQSYWSLGFSERGTKYRIALGTRDKLRAEALLQLFREDGPEAVRMAVREGKRRTDYAASLYWDPARGGKWRMYLAGPNTPRRSLSLGTRDADEAGRLRALWLSGDEETFERALAQLRMERHEAANEARKGTLRTYWDTRWRSRRADKDARI